MPSAEDTKAPNGAAGAPLHQPADACKPYGSQGFLGAPGQAAAPSAQATQHPPMRRAHLSPPPRQLQPGSRESMPRSHSTGSISLRRLHGSSRFGGASPGSFQVSRLGPLPQAAFCIDMASPERRILPPLSPTRASPAVLPKPARSEGASPDLGHHPKAAIWKLGPTTPLYVPRQPVTLCSYKLRPITPAHKPTSRTRWDVAWGWDVSVPRDKKVTYRPPGWVRLLLPAPL